MCHYLNHRCLQVFVYVYMLLQNNEKYDVSAFIVCFDS